MTKIYTTNRQGGKKFLSFLLVKIKKQPEKNFEKPNAPTQSIIQSARQLR